MDWFLLKFPGNKELAEDLTQEVLIRLSENLSRIDEDPKNYIKAIYSFTKPQSFYLGFAGAGFLSHEQAEFVLYLAVQLNYAHAVCMAGMLSSKIGIERASIS